MKKNPIDIFSDWALSGKDEGMEKNHSKSVDDMLKFSLIKLKNFSFIDAGCGNGWVVRKVSKYKECENAIGVDGSSKMINKAISLDKKNRYYCSNLLDWMPKKPADLVHSMEVFYYFKKPKKIIEHIYKNWIKIRGRLIMGIDFYYENEISHGWPDETNVNTMILLKEKDWIDIFKDVGFSNVIKWRSGKKKNWAGTLIITGIKN
tara:strand:- start:758 stop:1372 length:615 start_codon:yes stop_codon:yes gene_type:complete